MSMPPVHRIHWKDFHWHDFLLGAHAREDIRDERDTVSAFHCLLISLWPHKKGRLVRRKLEEVCTSN